MLRRGLHFCFLCSIFSGSYFQQFKSKCFTSSIIHYLSKTSIGVCLCARYLRRFCFTMLFGKIDNVGCHPTHIHFHSCIPKLIFRFCHRNSFMIGFCWCIIFPCWLQLKRFPGNNKSIGDMFCRQKCEIFCEV